MSLQEISRMNVEQHYFLARQKPNLDKNEVKAKIAIRAWSTQSCIGVVPNHSHSVPSLRK